MSNSPSQGIAAERQGELQDVLPSLYSNLFEPFHSYHTLPLD